MAKNKLHPEWGGKREGAGRKPLGDDPKNLSITLCISQSTKDTIAKLKPILKEDGLSVSTLFEKLVKDTAEYYGLE